MDQATRRTVPGPRTPMPAGLVGSLRGERVIVSNPDGCHYGYRAWSDVFTAPDGRSYVDVVKEEEWWEHRVLSRVQGLPGGAPVTPYRRWPTAAVWVE